MKYTTSRKSSLFSIVVLTCMGLHALVLGIACGKPCGVPDAQLISSLLELVLTMPYMPPSQVFLQSSLPVIQHYEAKGKVHRIYADRSPDEVYEEVRKLFL